MDHKEFSDLSKVPNPATDMDAFHRWVAYIEEKDIMLSERDLFKISSLPYSVLGSIMERISIKASSFPYLAHMAAAELLANDHPAEAIALLEGHLMLQTTEQLPWHKNILHDMYLSLIIAGSRSADMEVVDKYFNRIEDNWAQNQAQVYRRITLVNKHLTANQSLLPLKTEIETFLEHRKSHSSDANYGWLAMAYLSFLQNDSASCERALREVNYEFDVITPFAEKIFAHQSELLVLLAKEVAHKNHWFETKKRLDATALKISMVKMPVPTISTKHFSFYVHKQIDLEKLLWVQPISDQLFLGCTKAGTLFVAEISPTYDINMLQTIPLDSVQVFIFQDSMLYVTCYHEGILRFSLKNNRLHQEETIINTNRTPRYKALAIQDNTLYVNNFNQLEIFKLTTTGYELICERLYIGSMAFTLFVNGALLLANVGSDQYMLIDISDFQNPQYLSMIHNFGIGESNYVYWNSDYVIGSSILDLENPAKPRVISATGVPIAPFYNFSTILPDTCISSNSKGVIKAIPPLKGFKAAQPLFNCYEANKKRDFIPHENLASALTDHSLIVFDKRKITVLLKEEA